MYCAIPSCCACKLCLYFAKFQFSLKRMKKICFSLFWLACFSNLHSQNKALSPSEILQGLKKLNTVGSVLYIAAHPDDENTRLLAFMANEKKLRTAYLSLTRGDGGQNLIGKEQGEALGLIRTQELLAARRTDGAEQFFTRANDFGYSKNPEETFRFWNHDSILLDVVFTIRRFKPDVIVCRFPTTGEGGHGHHTASAILALEAFDAAADPAKFSWQLKYTGTWKSKRIYWNTFNFGGTNTTSPNQLKMDVGLYNVLLAKNYGEIAAESRSMHKSQGFGSARQRGSSLEYFKFLKGDSAKKDLFEFINTSWKRVPASAKTEALIAKCIKEFKYEMPGASVKVLTEIYKSIAALNDKDEYTRYWKIQKLKETEQLILACTGLWIEAQSADYIAVAGEPLALSAQIIARSSADVVLKKINYAGVSDTTMNLALKTNELYTFKRRERTPPELPYSTPYWLRNEHSEGLYAVNDPTLIGKAENDAALNFTFQISVAGFDMTLVRPLVYKNADPVKGEVYRPLEVLPPVAVNIPEKVFVFTGPESKTIQVTVKAHASGVSGSLELTCNEDFSIRIPTPNFTLKNKNDEVQIDAVVTPGKNAGKGLLLASVRINTALYGKSIRRVEYDHIPYQFMLNDATAKLVNIDLQKNRNNIAYVPGAGDEVESCLRQAGFVVTRLSDEMLVKEDLSRYEAVVTGVRAFNTNEKLQAQREKLLEYVKNGGNLIVQYNTNSRVGPLQANIGPYPFNITRDRVTDEYAEVRFTNPSHPALNTPNKITPADFEGWIQERGIYFAGDLDKQYETLLSMNDKDEKALDGSLITAKYGKGNFVYTGLVFFRELPAGVPGAYRLFANLIGLPRNN